MPKTLADYIAEAARAMSELNDANRDGRNPNANMTEAQAGNVIIAAAINAHADAVRDLAAALSHMTVTYINTEDGGVECDPLDYSAGIVL